MGFLPPYLLKISITLIVVYVVYWSLFRKLTFYAWNRFYLMVLSALSFVIPLVDISYLLRMKPTEVVAGYIPSLQSVMESSDSSAYQFFIGSPAWMNVIYLLVATGIVFFFIRLVIQYLSFRKMVRSADVIMEGSVRVYQVHEPIVPFSFANSIFINAAQHSEEELKEIIRHEFIHVKQRHSIDIMVSEILVMLNWFNPFAWMIRHSIRQNLEFIADEQVIRTGIDKRQYQYMLLKVIGASTFGITTKFNFNSLKKRIAMMNKNKTARVHLLRFALVLPVIGLSLVAFRGQQSAHSIMVKVTDTVPVKSQVKPENIESIHVKNKIVEITLKDGTTESFNLADPKQKAAYEKKYGKLPPPPPPPPAPAPPTPPTPTSVSGSVVMPDDIKSIDVITTKDGGKKITLVNKNGKTEIYDMNNAKQKAAFESKYGKISAQPEPPEAPGPVAVPEVSAVPAITAAPASVSAPVAPVPPPPVSQKASDDEFFKNNPNVRSVYIDDSNILFITLKNGQKEQYSLSEGKDKKMVIEKYGSLPKPPPPPPAPAKVGE